MASGTMASRFLGLLRESLFAAFFDRQITDAWTAAFRLPNLFRRLLGEGSLSVSFIPVFVETLQDSQGKQDNHRAQNLVHGVYTLLLLVLITITVLGVVGAEGLLHWLLDPSYIAQTEKFNLTLKMTQIMFGFIFLISHFAYYMGILNAFGQFGRAAFAPTLFNLAMITVTLFPKDFLSFPGEILAWGVLLGGFLQMAWLIPALVKLNYLPRFQIKKPSADVGRVFRNMLPGLMGAGLAQLTTLVNLSFASQLPEGTISHINWADRLLELPLSLVSVSLGTALLPSLAEKWAQKNYQDFHQTTQFYFRLNLYISILMSTGLFFLSRQIVEFLFQRGEFTTQDTLATTMILQIYALSVMTISSVRVLVPAFYAVKNTWYPAVSSGLCLGLHLLLAPYLIAQFQVSGLMLSTFLSGAINLLLLLLGYTIWIGDLGFGRVLKTVLHSVLSAALMAVVIDAVLTLIGTQLHALPLMISSGLKLFLAGGLSVLVSLIFGNYFKFEELEKIIAPIKRRLKR